MNSVSLGGAIEEFLKSPQSSYGMRTELSRFAVLCGRECPMFAIGPVEVREFMMETKKAGDRRKRAEALETFFCFARDKGWVRGNPASDIVRKKEPKAKPETACKPSRREAIQLTEEGRERIEAEVRALLAEKDKVIAQVKSSREEGDLKENAGYHDARERLALIEAQLRDKADILARGVPQE